MKLSIRTARMRARISELDDGRCRLTLDFPDEAEYERRILELLYRALNGELDSAETKPESG